MFIKLLLLYKVIFILLYIILVRSIFIFIIKFYKECVMFDLFNYIECNYLVFILIYSLPLILSLNLYLIMLRMIIKLIIIFKII